MNRDETFDNLRHALVNRRDALRAALQGDLSALRELELSTGDICDFAVDTSRGEVASQIAEVESSELQRIEEALSKINTGEYGECNDCGKSIPLARLEAIPYATLCIKCQTKAEQAEARGQIRYLRS
jgi:DnaK suppressor protein